ncbi:MAG: hypothetical protein R3C97_14115 [Geminicoccaceae bacterium]
MATVTEIYDYMRLLWARVGIPYSPATGPPIEAQTVSQMVDRVMAMPEGTRLYLLAPIVRGRKGEYRKEMAELMRRGFQRVKVDGEMYELDEGAAARQEEEVRDRGGGRPLRHRQRGGQRLAESIETALELADGLAGQRRMPTVASANHVGEVCLSGLRFHPAGNRTLALLVQQPLRRLVRHATGLGKRMLMDPDLVVPNPQDDLSRAKSEPCVTDSCTIIRRRLRPFSAISTKACTLGKSCRSMSATPSSRFRR